MHRLATVGAVTLLAAVGALCPFITHADVVQSIADTETTDSAVYDGGWTQFLGSGISGTPTDISFPIDWITPFDAANDRMGVTITSCSDSTYTSCDSVDNFNYSYLAEAGPNTISFNQSTLGFPIQVTFNPLKYYAMSIGRILSPGFNTRNKFKIFGSAADTYPNGSTAAGGLSDLAFISSY